MPRRFVDEYLKDLNATQAAIRAKYSEKTAYSIGQRLLKKVEVAAAIQKGMAERSERTKIDVDFVPQKAYSVGHENLRKPETAAWVGKSRGTVRILRSVASKALGSMKFRDQYARAR